MQSINLISSSLKETHNLEDQEVGPEAVDHARIERVYK